MTAETENWECYFCDPLPLEELRNQCLAVFDTISASDEKKSFRCAETSGQLPSSSLGPKTESEVEGTDALHRMFSRFEVQEDSVLTVTSQLYEATSTFRQVLKSVQQTSGIQNGGEKQMQDDEVQTIFTVPSDLNDQQRKQHCAKILKKGLHIYISSLGKIISINSKKNSKRDTGHDLPSADAKPNNSANVSKCLGTVSRKHRAAPRDCDMKFRASSGDASPRDEASDAVDSDSRKQDEKSVKENIKAKKTTKQVVKADGRGKSSLCRQSKQEQGHGSPCHQKEKKGCNDVDDKEKIEENSVEQEPEKVAQDKSSFLDASQEKLSISSEPKGNVQQFKSEKDDSAHSKKSSQDDNGQQEENVLAKFELIQELAEEFCKESSSASNVKEDEVEDKCNIDSDDDDLPCVTFEIDEDKNVEGKKQNRPNQREKQQRENSVEPKAFSDISDCDVVEGSKSASCKSMVVKIKMAKEDHEKETADFHGWEDLDSGSSNDIFTSSEDENESRNKQRRRKASK